jgi:hypothetical protein
MGGWVAGKAGLSIAYSNQKWSNYRTPFDLQNSFSASKQGSVKHPGRFLNSGQKYRPLGIQIVLDHQNN